MTCFDNTTIQELYGELEKLNARRKDVRFYHIIPDGQTKEEALADIDEEEFTIRERIDELLIAAEDFSEETF